MQQPGIAQDKAATPPGVVTPASPIWTTENGLELPRLQQAEHASAATESSWEQILVDAGLDRESRELSPAERALADRLTESRIRFLSVRYA